MEEKKLINFLNIKGIEYEIADKQARDDMENTKTELNERVETFESDLNTRMTRFQSDVNGNIRNSVNAINSQILTLENQIFHTVDESLSELRNEVYTISADDQNNASSAIGNNYNITNDMSRIDVLWRKVFPPKVTHDVYGYYLNTPNDIDSNVNISSFSAIVPNHKLTVNEGTSFTRTITVHITKRYLYILAQKNSTIGAQYEGGISYNMMSVDPDDGSTQYTSSEMTLTVDGSNINFILYKFDFEDDSVDFNVKITITEK